MTQEEVNNLKVGDCFKFDNYSVCKVTDTSRVITYIYIRVNRKIVSFMPDMFLHKTSKLWEEANFIDSKDFDKIMKILSITAITIENIIAGS